MAFRLKLRPAAARDIYKLTKKNKELGPIIATRIIPDLIQEPLKGRMKRGDLKKFRSMDFDFQGVCYRILYEIEGDFVRVHAAGVHDVSYRKTKSRL
jgi:hypothetical protein